MGNLPDYAQFANMAMLEEQYRRFMQDPKSVDPSWRYFFEGMDCAACLQKMPAGSGGGEHRIAHLASAYRRYGHLLASTNPLESPPQSRPELDLGVLGFSDSELDALFPTLGFCEQPNAPLREIIAALQTIYASRIGCEYVDSDAPGLEAWMQGQMETRSKAHLSPEEKRLLFDALIQSEVFETFLHTRYVGQTRFSLEGNESAIPVLAEIIDCGARLGIEEFWIGMAHRGRLNVLANILKKPYSVLFEEFEDDTALSLFGNDDVKYHMGFFSELQTKSGQKISIGLPPNPSHLESVDPILLGFVRAKQVERQDEEGKRTAPIMIHGDAALSGQGVVYESLQLAKLSDYSVGGTIHLVLNNQIGYTTLPKEGRSTRYCTDIAKAFGMPVFHVNAEDPESCMFVAKLAVELRQAFHCDVFIDLIGYRKYGHNEGDEPSYTQPLEYRQIRSRKSIRQIYLDRLVSEGHLDSASAEKLDGEFKEQLRVALETAQQKKAAVKKSPKKTASPKDLPTAVGQAVLRNVMDAFCLVPSSFHLHPKLQKWLQDRKSLEGIDWSSAECLAFGSLLLQKVQIRLAGQDSRRGTFSQRHLVWTDAENGASYCPFHALGARLDVVNSPLTEYAGMGFEYGYSYGVSNGLVLWEAQYGDFDNGAQIVIDQYIASAEQKWHTHSSLTLLLPHGYEGAGPEHSSARLERFLQLSALDNIQVAYPSTPAQYFHLLRRQALSTVKKPLVVLTPKGLLRAKACVSTLSELTAGRFEEVLDDPAPPKQGKRLILCSGKVFYDLLAEREKTPNAAVAIVRLEQLYPFPASALKTLMAKYRGVQQYVWVQEEPQNMGAWSFVQPILQELAPKGTECVYVGRSSNATPATGSHRKHKEEQSILMNQALGNL